VYNPQAGKMRRRPELFARALDVLRQQWPEVVTVATEGPQTAGSLVAQCITKGAGMILVAGGDGTVNEALAGVAGTEVPFGVLPFGTANVLSNELRMGNNPVRVAELLKHATPVPVALGRMITESGSRLFLSMAGAGLDARVVRIVNPKVKSILGKYAYWLYAFEQVGRRLHQFRVRVCGREYVTSFALISRVRNYGGDIEIARRANLLEDHFAVVLCEGLSASRYLKYFGGVVFNTLDRMSGVHVLESTSVEIEPIEGSKLDLQLDGEHVGFGAARYEIVEASVRLLIPAPYLSVMTPATVRLQYESF
jgi:diacylglycerol kinase family enzyme